MSAKAALNQFVREALADAGCDFGDCADQPVERRCLPCQAEHAYRWMVRRASIPWSFCPACGIEAPRPGRHHLECPMAGKGP